MYAIRSYYAKKKVKVGPPTLNPPHTHKTIKPPQIGIVEIKLVITVAPQKDICPHGKT